MNHADRHLEALWRDDLPAAHDPVFRLAVLQRMERRGFVLRMSLILGLGVTCAGGLWVMLPSLAAPIAAGLPLAGLILVSALAFAWGAYRVFRSV